MNPYERRIIHAALSDVNGVKTESEGKEPNRYIVVIPDNLEDPNAPALEARNGRDRRDRDRDRGGRGYNRGRNDRGGKGGFNRGKSAGSKNFNRSGRDSSSAGGTAMKPSNDFFGIFLGNSGNKEE